jgi:hypothetical protein
MRISVKTTVEISDSLLREACKLAAREGVTLRTLIERGLRRVVADAGTRLPFKLGRASFNGKGLLPEHRGASWEKLCYLIYEDHGA